MNGVTHGKWNLRQKKHVLEMVKSGMRPTRTFRFGQNIMPIEKEEKDLWVIIQNNLSPEKHADKMFDYTFS